MYSNLKKSELIAILNERDSQLVIMEQRCSYTMENAQKQINQLRAAKPSAEAPKKHCVLKPVKGFANKADLLVWAGDKIGSFVVTTNEVSGELVANLRTWV